MNKLNLSNLAMRLMALTMVAGMFFMAGCGDDDGGGNPSPDQNVWQIVDGRSELSDLASELERANLTDALANTDNITLFAPSNQAMQTLLNTLGLPDFSPIREDIAEAVLTYHVATSIQMAADLTVGKTIPTLQGEMITVAGGPTLVTGATSDAGFVTTNLEASNGVVHIVDVVLVPPTIAALITQTLGTVAQPILLGKDFSTLAAAISKADAGKEEANTILGAMVNGDAVTVFGPVNAVFEGASITLDTYTAEQWDAIIRGHMVDQTLSPLADAADIMTYNDGVTVSTTAAVDPAFGTVQGSGNDAAINIATAGVPAGNGVVYPIAGVIQ